MRTAMVAQRIHIAAAALDGLAAGLEQRIHGQPRGNACRAAVAVGRQRTGTKAVPGRGDAYHAPFAEHNLIHQAPRSAVVRPFRHGRHPRGRRSAPPRIAETRWPTGVHQPGRRIVIGYQMTVAAQRIGPGGARQQAGGQDERDQRTTVPGPGRTVTRACCRFVHVPRWRPQIRRDKARVAGRGVSRSRRATPYRGPG